MSGHELSTSFTLVPFPDSLIDPVTYSGILRSFQKQSKSRIMAINLRLRAHNLSLRSLRDMVPNPWYFGDHRKTPQTQCLVFVFQHYVTPKPRRTSLKTSSITTLKYTNTIF
jgi:hypothetical protein